jgi:heme A synthase
MYAAALILHSWIRWAALVAGVGATIMVWRERSGSMRSRTDRWGRVLVGALDVQLLLGLWLYLALSPFTAGVRSNVDVVMADPTLRFWNVEHPAMMLVAVMLVHIGRVLARKAATARARRWRLLVCFGTATLLMIAGLPWFDLARRRPLFRFSL